MMTVPSLIFDAAPYRGWDASSEQADQHRFAFTRDQVKPIDWQGGRNRVQHDIPFGHPLRQNMGPQLMTLTPGLIFPDRFAFERFWEQQDRDGTIRMQRDWTVWPSDRDRVYLGVTYAEWDNVGLDQITNVTKDQFGVVHCIATFVRRDPSWS